MSTNQTLLSIVALAGNKDAALHAAFADLSRGIVQFCLHGNKNPLNDTRDALATLGKRAQVSRVAAMVQSAFDAANIAFDQFKRTDKVASEAAAARILAECIAAYDAAETVASEARAAKAAETKAAKVAAEKALKRAAKSIAPLKVALTVADAIETLRNAAASGDEQALSGIEALTSEFFDVATA